MGLAGLLCTFRSEQIRSTGRNTIRFLNVERIAGTYARSYQPWDRSEIDFMNATVVWPQMSSYWGLTRVIALAMIQWVHGCERCILRVPALRSVLIWSVHSQQFFARIGRYVHLSLSVITLCTQWLDRQSREDPLAKICLSAWKFISFVFSIC